MSEIQRLKAEDPDSVASSGQFGSLKVSDLRLPLKEEFLTKLGTADGKHSNILLNCFYLFVTVLKCISIIFQEVVCDSEKLVKYFTLNLIM